MSRIFWDTNLFIYLLEPNEEFSPMTRELRIKMLRRGDVLLTSTITLGEVLVKPMQAGDEQRCRKLRAGHFVSGNSNSVRYQGGETLCLDQNWSLGHSAGRSATLLRCHCGSGPFHYQ